MYIATSSATSTAPIAANRRRSLSVKRFSIVAGGSVTGSALVEAAHPARIAASGIAVLDYSTLTTSVRAKSSPTKSNGQSCDLATS